MTRRITVRSGSVPRKVAPPASSAAFDGSEIAAGSVTATELADDYVNVDGDTMAGVLNMGEFDISNVGNIGLDSIKPDATDITIFKADGTTVSLLWDESDDRWEYGGDVGIVLPVKTTTGDPASPAEGQLIVNTFDNKIRVYADGAWRDLATW